MRQCDELGLHRRPIKPLPPFEEQTQRNLFRDCYVHDRYNSGILGRPYAIAEHDIEPSLPVKVTENQILHSEVDSLDAIDIPVSGRPNETSVFLFVIGL